MKDTQKKKAAKEFAAYWKDRGYEKGEGQSFWRQLLQQVFGVENPESFIKFELPVKLDKTKYIDAYIPSTQVLIEQKNKGIDLSKEYKQSDGRMMTPYRQAREYAGSLAHDQNPRWIIVCNFHTFEIHDMNRPNDPPEIIQLSDFEKEYYRLQFLVEEKNEILRREYQVSIDAGKLVGKLYNALLKQYGVTDESEADEETLKSLNRLCVRLVFCLYAEDAGIFGGHNKFHDYIKKVADKDIYDVRSALLELFSVLNQPYENRSKFIRPELAAFPYVNGGLFKEDDSEIPNFTQEIIDLLLHNASEDFDWSQISPTIFGALFESTLNPSTRRKGGMHYTSIENIHKVIDPLFLNELNKELEEISAIKVEKNRNTLLDAFRKKIGSLTFFDPACGSGNFLTETYLSLRRLENKALELIQKYGQINFELGDVIKVSIGQFYGIEINDFAVTVARTALWIAESQMMKETEELLQINLDFLPLKSYANIVEGNALRVDWETVVPKDKLNYIMGNPPYAGFNVIDDEPNEDMRYVFKNQRGRLDYVSAWFLLAAKFIQGTQIECGYVATNSVIQGGHIYELWDTLINGYNIHINFAYKAFSWKNEASAPASVHCVILGFSIVEKKQKIIYDYDSANDIMSERLVDYISPYLDEKKLPLIKSRRNPLATNIPIMGIGNLPRDFGHYIFKTDEEMYEFISKEPKSEKYIFKYIGSEQYLSGTHRWILYLRDCPLSELNEMKYVKERVVLVKQARKNSKNKQIQMEGDKPTLFARNPQDGASKFMLIPEYQSPNRKYIPISFFEKGVLISDTVQFINEWNYLIFGILSSSLHFSWMNVVCGALGAEGTRYSTGLVYNNFPFIDFSPECKAKIEKTAKEILNVREDIMKKDPHCKISTLYNDNLMPSELRDAHKANDKAVAQAYGFKKTDSEAEIVAKLMKMYQQLLEGETSGSPKRHSK